MNQIYLVVEDNGESYEDYQEWPIAAFDSEDKAKEYADNKQKEYTKSQKIGLLEQPAHDEESNSLYAANPYDWREDKELYSSVCDSIYEYLNNKYPNVSSLDYSTHSFKVSKPISFNPS